MLRLSEQKMRAQTFTDNVCVVEIRIHLILVTLSFILRHAVDHCAAHANRHQNPREWETRHFTRKKKKKDNRGKKKNSNKLRSSKWVLWYPLSCSRCARLRWLQRRVYKGWPRSCDSACWQTGGGSERVFKCGGCWHPLLQRTKNNTSGKRTRMYKFSSCAKNNNNKKQEKHGKKKRTINSVWKPFFSQGE